MSYSESIFYFTIIAFYTSFFISQEMLAYLQATKMFCYLPASSLLIVEVYFCVTLGVDFYE